MKNRKISIITSSIAACAIFASIITFNGFAAESKNAGIPKAENSITAVNPATIANNQEQTPVVTPISINTTSAKNTTCPITQNTQSSNNIQTNIKSADITKVISNLQNSVNNANCNKTTAKTTNYSALQSRINALLKSFNKSCTAKTTNNSSAAKPAASKPSTSTGKKTATKPAAGTTNGSYSAFQKKVVELVNQERAKNGLKPLTMNSNLNKTATLKSQDMAKLNYFDHTSPTYGSPFNMMRNYGISYRTAGENIAMGQTTPEQVMQGWMNSPGHRANILNPSFTQIGVGVAKNSSGTLYWTQQFIG